MLLILQVSDHPGNPVPMVTLSTALLVLSRDTNHTFTLDIALLETLFSDPVFASTLPKVLSLLELSFAI